MAEVSSCAISRNFLYKNKWILVDYYYMALLKQNFREITQLWTIVLIYCKQYRADFKIFCFFPSIAETLLPFAGVVHSRDYRKPKCSGYGENTKLTILRINMLAEKGADDYCGIFVSDPASDERSVAVAVRTHRTLELVDDKFYMITCGKAGFQNTK